MLSKAVGNARGGVRFQSETPDCRGSVESASEHCGWCRDAAERIIASGRKPNQAPVQSPKRYHPGPARKQIGEHRHD